MDVDARIQLFDLKTKYQFQTQPGYDQYNMPIYQIQTESGNQQIKYYPIYQGFSGPAYVNGVAVPFYTDKSQFFNTWPNIVQLMTVNIQGDGTAGPYNFQFPIAPNNTLPNPLNTPFQYLLRGHVDITGLIALANSAYGNYTDPPIVNNAQATVANGSIASVPVANCFPAVYITSNLDDGTSIVVSDSGQFLSGNQNLGLLMSPGTYPKGNAPLTGGYQNSFAITGITNANPAVITANTNFQVGQTVEINNVGGMTELNGKFFTVTAVSGTTVTINVNSTTFGVYTAGGTISSFSNLVNYFTGQITNLTFPQAIPSGVNIAAQCYFFQSGLPRGILYNNNVITLRSPPSQQWLVEIDAYLTPAAFLNSSQSIQFAYMSEYIARGAARKILSDTGDVEQFNFYEPLFLEQESLVHKRSQRQFTSTRTPTIYSHRGNQINQGVGLGGITN